MAYQQYVQVVRVGGSQIQAIGGIGPVSGMVICSGSPYAGQIITGTAGEDGSQITLNFPPLYQGVKVYPWQVAIDEAQATNNWAWASKIGSISGFQYGHARTYNSGPSGNQYRITVDAVGGTPTVHTL